MAWGSGLSGNRETRVETKSTFDINSPRLLETIRGSMYGVEGDSSMRVSAVYACVKVLSESIGAMPLNLYATGRDNATTRKYNKVDRLVSIAPSEYQTASELWSWVVTCMSLHGNAYVYMNKTASNKVVELIPVSPQNVTINIDGHRVTYTVTVGSSENQRTITMTKNELLHFKGTTLDGFTGISPIVYNNSLISGERTAVNYANHILTDGATPRGVLEVAGELSDDAFHNLKESWNAAHSGDRNGNRLAVLEQGVQFKPISMSPNDLSLLESRKYSRAEIAGIFRVPPHMIGEMSASTYSNITEQSKAFYRYTLSPIMTALEQRLNHTLAAPGELFKFDIDGLVRPELSVESESYSKLISIGVLNPNEVRERMGLNPREGGDEFISQTNNLEFGGAEQPAEEEAPKSPQQEEGEPNEESTES